jgi:hypothetical protein
VSYCGGGCRRISGGMGLSRNHGESDRNCFRFGWDHS